MDKEFLNIIMKYINEYYEMSWDDLVMNQIWGKHHKEMKSIDEFYMELVEIFALSVDDGRLVVNRWLKGVDGMEVKFMKGVCMDTPKGRHVSYGHWHGLIEQIKRDLKKKHEHEHNRYNFRFL